MTCPSYTTKTPELWPLSPIGGLSLPHQLSCLCPGSWFYPPSCLPDQALNPSDLDLLLLHGIDNGGAAHLSDFATLPVERPAADLIPQDILEEEQSPVEPQGQFVKQLDVLKKVVI